MTTLRNYIAGAFVPATTGQTIDDIGPATGQVIARIPRSGAADVDAAVQAAQQARTEWASRPVLERADFLDRIADVIEERHGELSEMESLDTGKPISLASAVDIPRAVANFRFFAGAVRHARGDFFEMSGALNYTLRRPLGVVGLITPWNLPLYLLSWKTAPALAMGNTIVAKPSELTPLTANALAEVIDAAGLPKGTFNLVQGYGAEAGQAIVEHEGVKAVSFTGGTATGKRVAATAAQTFKKLSLELGGKNPTLIFDDCDFDRTLEGTLRSGFLNQGQVCLCGSRVFVQRGVYDRYVEALCQAVEAMPVGDPSDAETRLGALISLEHREKVEGYIALAREEGGTIAAGGTRPQLQPPLDNGAFLRPTVITGLDNSCRVAQEEIFGPVVTVHPFDTEEDALAMANDVQYGLAASVWTTDVSRAHRVADALETGMVWVNTWLLRDLRVPFGGVKASGVGREGGEYSMRFFSEDKNVCLKL